MRLVLAITLILFSEYANAFELIELNTVDVTYRSFFKGGSDPLITQNGLQDRALGKELNLTMTTSVVRYFYFDSVVHSQTDKVASRDAGGQFRVVGLEFGAGLDLKKIWNKIPVSIGYYHYSQHLLDTTYSQGRFPVKDAVEIKVRLYGK